MSRRELSFSLDSDPVWQAYLVERARIRNATWIWITILPLASVGIFLAADSILNWTHDTRFNVGAVMFLGTLAAVAFRGFIVDSVLASQALEDAGHESR